MIKKVGLIALFVIVLILIATQILSYQTEKPLYNSDEQLSPYNHIKEDQIKVYPDKIIIYIDNPSWASYTNTNSMDPLLDEDANGLEIIPKNPNTIHVGDIVAYEPSWTSGLVVHRVIETNEDNYGWYAILKGDNATEPDPEKVRFNQIKYLLVGVIY